MSQHTSRITWKRTTPTFSYEDYNRDHIWEVKDGVTISASAAPDFLGTHGHCDPEEALVSALSSCHMLTFLVITSKKRYVVDSYEDTPVGYLEPNEKGIQAILRIELQPKVVFSGEKQPTLEELKALHDKAHHHCFVANSIRAEVVVV